MLQAIIFDFDGVVADNEPIHFAMFRQVLGEIGLPLTESEYYAKYLGYDDKHSRLCRMTDCPSLIDDLVVRKGRVSCSHHTAPRDFSWRARTGPSRAVPLAIHQGAPHDRVHPSADPKAFEHITSSEDVSPETDRRVLNAGRAQPTTAQANGPRSR
jgi:hypothetical protein